MLKIPKVTDFIYPALQKKIVKIRYTMFNWAWPRNALFTALTFVKQHDNFLEKFQEVHVIVAVLLNLLKEK